jgi:hypothetical protein
VGGSGRSGEGPGRLELATAGELTRGRIVASDGGPLNGIFPGDQSLGWPNGVQEEDPPIGWNWTPPPLTYREVPRPVPELVEGAMQRPPTHRVAAHIALGAAARKDRD